MADEIIRGKTYTLHGESGSTSAYYSQIKSLADIIQNEYAVEDVLEAIWKYSPKKRYLRKTVGTGNTNTLIARCVNLIHCPLKPYTREVENHLKHLPFRKLWDRRLATTEEQYHLYMLEIELTNRQNRTAVLASGRKISLQPYCLKDISVNCKASKSGFDVQCKSCSKVCYENKAGRILKGKGVEPYIWMGAGLKEAAKESGRKNQTFGVIGIACIPELVFGMRKCRRYNIPSIGLPLNGNCCIRWFGEFHANSIDLDELEKLLR